MNRFDITDEWSDITAALSTTETDRCPNGYGRRGSTLSLVKIGKDYYQLKMIRTAYQILGKKMRAYEHTEKCYQGLKLVSDQGSGFILPVRYIPN